MPRGRHGGTRRGAGRRRLYLTANERLAARRLRIRQQNIGQNILTSSSNLDHNYASPAAVNNHNGNSFYRNYAKFETARKYIKKYFYDNPFGYECSVCERLWFKNCLSPCLPNFVTIIQNIVPNVHPNNVLVCPTCKSSLSKGKNIYLISY